MFSIVRKAPWLFCPRIKDALGMLTSALIDSVSPTLRFRAPPMDTSPTDPAKRPGESAKSLLTPLTAIITRRLPFVAATTTMALAIAK